MAITRDFKDRWLKGLRAGRYEQGRLDLERDGKYCCLGVACAVNGFSTKVCHENGGYFQLIQNGVDAQTQQVLWMMNDGQKASFADIADWIEVNL